MSHNNFSFGGILSPLVESLEKKARQQGHLIGQDVILPDSANVNTIIAVDAEDNIHLLISPANNDDNRFSRLDLKGLNIENREWSVSGHATQTYLDVSCAIGALPAFRRPFLRFAEDVLFEISKATGSPDEAVYRTGMRWKKFWSTDVPAEVTLEWLYGIAGELSFLIHLLREFGSGVVGNWAGPSGKDHDFQAGTDVAFEVKASNDIPFKIHCNIRQLDPSLFKKLYVVCYQVTSSESGVTVPELVGEIENMFADDEGGLDNFHEKLISAGYSRQAEQIYTQHRLTISSPAVFLVNESFPKIIESSFKSPPDHRIRDIRYTVQITGQEELSLDDVSNDLKLLKK